MRKLNVFNFVTLNGFYKGPQEDISWHRHGGEENEVAAEGLGSDSIILFGRVTYKMMASYWPSPEALKDNPEVAKGMNAADKIVFSKTLKSASWNNTKIVPGNIVEEVRKMKQTAGKDMIVLGSGSIVTHFADHGLVDEYLIMIDPVALGRGTPIFNGLSRKLDLTLTNSRTFKSGVVYLSYKAMT